MSYFDRFSINLQKALKLSIDAAKYYGSSYVGSEHILFGILNVPECRACKILRAAGIFFLQAWIRTAHSPFLGSSDPQGTFTFPCT